MKITRLFDFAYYQLETHNLDAALVSKKNGGWVKTSTKSYLNKANSLSRALLKLGVKKNDKIAVISSTNRTEWCIVDIGVLQVGAQNIPIYPTISANDYEYVLNHSQATYWELVADKRQGWRANAAKARRRQRRCKKRLTNEIRYQSGITNEGEQS